MTTFASMPQPPSDPRPEPASPVEWPEASPGASRGGIPAATARGTIPEGPIRLSNRLDLVALLTVVRITADRQGRGRRLLVMSLLFALPIVLAFVTRRYQDPYRADEVENVLVFGLIFQALVPVTALLFASGMVQDDIEEQTLTYFLIRPIPRWAIYLAKLAGTFVVTAVCASVFTVGSLAIVHWDEGSTWRSVMIERVPPTMGLVALALSAYVAIFGGLSLLVRRTLVVGTIYIVVLEGLVANIDFSIRYATVMYYIRVLSVRWLGLPGADWSIDPEVAPSASTCLIVLLTISGLVALLGAWVFGSREFRVKTPEGS